MGWNVYRGAREPQNLTSGWHHPIAVAAEASEIFSIGSIRAHRRPAQEYLTVANALSPTDNVFDIMRLKAEYCESVDQCLTNPAKGSERLREVFAEDTVVDYGQTRLSGREETTAFLAALGATRDWLWHTIHTPNISVGENCAKGSWTSSVMMREKGGSKTLTVFGRYRDTFRRKADGSWEITEIRWVAEHHTSD